MVTEESSSAVDADTDRARWEELYEQCCELGIVGIEFRRPSLRELETLLRDHERGRR